MFINSKKNESEKSKIKKIDVIFDKDYIDKFKYLLITESKNISIHCDNVTEESFYKYKSNRIVNTRFTRSFEKKDGSNKWHLVYRYSFDVLNDDAYKLYLLLEEHLSGNHEIYYEILERFLRYRDRLNCLRREMLISLRKIDFGENEQNVFEKNMVEYLILKNKKIYKYYEMLINIAAISYAKNRRKEEKAKTLIKK